MSRQMKWLLIMAAGLAVFGLGQLDNSLATPPGGGESHHHGPPGAPPAPPPTAPPAPPPTVTSPGAITRDLPPPPSTAPPVMGGGCEPGGLPPGEPHPGTTIAQAPPATEETGGTSGPVTTTPGDTAGSKPPTPPPPGGTGGTRFIPGVTAVGAPPILPPTRVAPGTPRGYDNPPATGGVCHDYVGDRIGAPSPNDGVKRSYGELTSFLDPPKGGGNYTPGKPTDPLTPGTVIQWGTAHVGIVGPDGRIYNYTQAAPSHGIYLPDIHANSSIDEVTNKTGPRQEFNPDGTVTTREAQPYKNLPVKVWHPK